MVKYGAEGSTPQQQEADAAQLEAYKQSQIETLNTMDPGELKGMALASIVEANTFYPHSVEATGRYARATALLQLAQVNQQRIFSPAQELIQEPAPQLPQPPVDFAK